MAKKKYYCVIKGRTPGIYTDWESCEKQVNGYKGSKFKAFKTMEEVEQYIEENKSE